MVTENFGPEVDDDVGGGEAVPRVLQTRRSRESPYATSTLKFGKHQPLDRPQSLGESETLYSNPILDAFPVARLTQFSATLSAFPYSCCTFYPLMLHFENNKNV